MRVIKEHEKLSTILSTYLSTDLSTDVNKKYFLKLIKNV